MLTTAQRSALRIPHIRRMVERGYTANEIVQAFRGTALAGRRQTILEQVRPFQQAVRYRPQIERLPETYLIPKRLHVQPRRFLSQNFKYDVSISFTDAHGVRHTITQSVTSDYQRTKASIVQDVSDWLSLRYGITISDIDIQVVAAYTQA